jgi:hypothetical protein
MAYMILIAIWALIGFSGWRVFTRAGFKGFIGLLFLVPVLNFVALLYLAHKDWPSTNNQN